MPTVVVSDDEITCGRTQLIIYLPATNLDPHPEPLQEPTEKE